MIKSIFSVFRESTNSFDGEEDGEKVILLLRRHPFFIIVKMFFYIILFLAPFFLGFLFYPVLISNNLLILFFFVVSLWYSFVWASAFYSLTMYTLDVWIVTNKRIIDSTQHGFFNRTVSELHIARIQDTSVQTKGVIQTFLHFGDLQVQTAGTEEKFKFLQIPNPERAKDEIMKLVSNQSNHL